MWEAGEKVVWGGGGVLSLSLLGGGDGSNQLARSGGGGKGGKETVEGVASINSYCQGTVYGETGKGSRKTSKKGGGGQKMLACHRGEMENLGGNLLQGREIWEGSQLHIFLGETKKQLIMGDAKKDLGERTEKKDR